MSYKILAIDDDPQLTHLLERILTREGYEFEYASSARQGLWQAYAFQPDVVLLEVVLPDMNGWQTLTALRAFSDVPVIMVTSLDDAEHKIRSLDAGADDVLTKPFKVDELGAHLRAILRRTITQPLWGRRRSWLLEPRQRIDPLLRLTPTSKTASLTPAEYLQIHSLALGADRERGSSQALAGEFWRLDYAVSMN